MQAPGQLSSQFISPIWSPSALNSLTPLSEVRGPWTITELSFSQPTAEHVADKAVGRHEAINSAGRIELNILVKDRRYMAADISRCDGI